MFIDQESEKLIGSLAERLKRQKLFMCTAESCTGGLIAAMCTSLAGSSEWFTGGIVSYSNAMKESILQVPNELLEQHGAVSLAVVEHMALGALKVCQSQAVIAVSGIAGPGGGSADKPVGTVCLAAAIAATVSGTPQLNSQIFHFAGDRAEIRWASAKNGLKMLLALLD